MVAENYHECYHCPLIHPELCAVSPPDSGDNYDLPGSWVGGSMDLRDGMATMSLTGELAATPLPGVDPMRVEYLHLLPNLLVSAHPDYVMAHRMVPLAPGRTWIECSWYVDAEWSRRARHRRPRRRRLLGHHQQAGLGGVRVGAAWAGQPALQPRPVRAEGGRRRAPGAHHRRCLPQRQAGAVMQARRRLLTATIVVAGLATSALASTTASASPVKPDIRRHAVSDSPSAGQRLATRAHKVGSLTLHSCDVVEGALCGSVRRLWEPGHPAAGKVSVGFAFVPAADTSKPVLGTVVPHEGGPGYSTTGTGEDYAQMYGPLLQRRNLLLVDQRGTGLSAPIDCPALQNLTIAYNVAAARCGR